MKKIMLAAGLILSTTMLRADPLADQITAAFVGSAKMAVEFTTKGKTQYEFLSNFIEIGRLNGSPVAGLDIGALGEQLPDNTIESVKWTSGAKLHLSPIIKSWVALDPAWQFINNLEIDGRYSYNWTDRHASLGLSIAYPWR